MGMRGEMRASCSRLAYVLLNDCREKLKHSPLHTYIKGLIGRIVTCHEMTLQCLTSKPFAMKTGNFWHAIGIRIPQVGFLLILTTKAITNCMDFYTVTLYKSGHLWVILPFIFIIFGKMATERDVYTRSALDFS